MEKFNQLLDLKSALGYFGGYTLGILILYFWKHISEMQVIIMTLMFISAFCIFKSLMLYLKKENLEEITEIDLFRDDGSFRENVRNRFILNFCIIIILSTTQKKVNGEYEPTISRSELNCELAKIGIIINYFALSKLIEYIQISEHTGYFELTGNIRQSEKIDNIFNYIKNQQPLTANND